MNNAIAKYVLTKKNTEKTQKQKVAEIVQVLSKHKIPKKVLLESYNKLHHRNQIPYVTFCYKLRMFTFTESELLNLTNMVDSAVNAIKNSEA